MTNIDLLSEKLAYKSIVSTADRDRDAPRKKPLTIQMTLKFTGIPPEFWSESIAVGSKIFIENIKEKLGISKKGRKVVENNDNFIL
jgi:hypothetical protein